ncbi:alkaline-phosphatase-like protein [Mycena galopus ATCC 62051]|nr:alkaline-phosphatase-like protein [Mycena galopus ATCC 62051]
MDALIGGEGAHVGEGKTVVDDIKANYEKAVTDEFLKPVIVNGEEGRIKATPETHNKFPAHHNLSRYNPDYPFPPQAVTNVPAEWLAKQAHVAETEKYAHVTFFFKGGIEKQLMLRSGAWWIHQRSGVCVVWIAIMLRFFLFTWSNLLGLDLCGRCTGREIRSPATPHRLSCADAAVKAISATNQAVGTVAAAYHDAWYILLTAADHGNAEQMRNPETGKRHTAHTCGAVPFILVGGKEGEYTLKDDERDGKEKTTGRENEGEEEEEGALCDVAPTVLELMGLPKPEGASYFFYLSLGIVFSLAIVAIVFKHDGPLAACEEMKLILICHTTLAMHVHSQLRIFFLPRT